MRRFLSPLFLFSALLFAVYMALVLIRPQAVFWSLDEGGKLLYIQNVLATGSISAPLAYPGRALDPQAAYVPLFFAAQDGDQFYSWWPVGFPLLTLPFYLLLGFAGLYVLPALGGVACSVLAALIAGRLAQRLPDVSTAQRRSIMLTTALVTGLATPVLFYATTFWEHTPSVALLLAGLWLALRAAEDECPWCALGAGAAVSLAGFLRTEQLFAAVGILAVLLLWRPRHGLRMAAGLLSVTPLWLAFNYLSMGSWISRQWGEGGGDLTGSLFPGVREAGLFYLPYLLFNAPKVIAYALSTPLLAAGTLLATICLLLPLVGRLRPALWGRLWPALTLAYLLLAALCTYILLHPEGYRSVHGLLLIAPHLVCFVWLQPTLRRSARWQDAPWPALMLSAAALLVLAAFVARSWLAAGGQQWGSRYLLVLYPLLTAAASVGLHWLFAAQSAQAAQSASPAGWPHSPLARRGLGLAAALLVLVGVGFQVRGQGAIWTTVQNYRLTQQAFAELDHTPKLTDCSWLPMVIPELYWRGDIFARHDVQQPPGVWLDSIRSLGAAQGQWLEVDMCWAGTLDNVQAQRQGNPSGLTIQPIADAP